MAKSSTEDLPGVEGEGVSRKTIKALDTAIEAWNAVKEKRMALTEKECDAKAAVREMMHKHEVSIYRYDDEHEVILTDGVKVRRVESVEVNGE